MTEHKPNNKQPWMQVVPQWWPVIMGCVFALIYAGIYWQKINDHLSSIDQQMQVLQRDVGQIRAYELERQSHPITLPPISMRESAQYAAGN